MSNINLGYISEAADLGIMLRLLRTERRMTVREVAAATGVSFPSIARYETNGCVHVPFESLVKLLDCYGVAIKLEEKQS